MRWTWIAEDEAPTPAAALATGALSRTLLDRIAARAEAERLALTLTAHADLLLVAGAVDALPWLDGVRYAAPRGAAPGLWLPTHCRPSLPLDLVDRAIARRHPERPVLLWPSPAQLLPLARLLPASDAVIARIRRHWSGG